MFVCLFVGQILIPQIVISTIDTNTETGFDMPQQEYRILRSSVIISFDGVMQRCCCCCQRWELEHD